MDKIMRVIAILMMPSILWSCSTHKDMISLDSKNEAWASCVRLHINPQVDVACHYRYRSPETTERFYRCAASGKQVECREKVIWRYVGYEPYYQWGDKEITMSKEQYDDDEVRCGILCGRGDTDKWIPNK